MKIIPKYRNKINISIKVSGVGGISSCIFPDKFYNDVIYINCTFSGLNQNYPFKGDYKYFKNNYRIEILYSTIKFDNFLNSNTIFSDNKTIIHGNLDIICPTSSSSSSFPSSSPNTDEINNETNEINRTYIRKKLSKKKFG